MDYKLPYIIIAGGPTGSGKTGLINKVINYLNLEKSYEKILIDDLIENNKKYKETILNIIREIQEKCKKEKKKYNTNTYFKDPNYELITKFNDAYYLSKYEPNCTNDSKFNCNDLHDSLLQKAFSEKKNIVFETTSGYIPKWLLNSEPFTKHYEKYEEIPYIHNTKNPYKIIFAYSIVPFNELIKRNIFRTIESIDLFLKDSVNSLGPRLPNIEESYFKKVVSNIKDVLLDIYKNCILSFNESICGKEKINTLLIFDNSYNKLIPVFDSEKDTLKYEDFCDLVDKLFVLNLFTNKSGKNKKSKNKKKTKIKVKKITKN